MSNMEKLQKEFDLMKANGLVDMKVAVGDLTDATPESVAGELLAMLAAIKAGKARPFSFGDSRNLCNKHGGCGFVSDCKQCALLGLTTFNKEER